MQSMCCVEGRKCCLLFCLLNKAKTNNNKATDSMGVYEITQSNVVHT